VTSARPSIDLVRSTTDGLVVRCLITHHRLTRAELAAHAGISKPTASESVRRLMAAGLLRDTGERTTGRGRVGTYYGLSGDLGHAIVVGVAPGGIVAEAVDVHGDVLDRAQRAVSRPARHDEVAAALHEVAGQVLSGHDRRARLATVSAADPVDRTTGRLVHLPDAPFLVGGLDPTDALSGLVDGPVLVDNDVNWAARAERAAAPAPGPADFAYLHLGEGLGCAVVSDGQVHRGHRGLAGEIAHLVTPGPDGGATSFTEVFAALGLRRPGSTAIDVDALLDTAAGSARTRRAIAQAVCGVLAAVVALADPELVVVGGEWGSRPAIIGEIRDRFARLPRHVPVRPAAVRTEPALTGARAHAVAALQAAVTGLATRPDDPGRRSVVQRA
jgi:predicted NBD/HSP70 family sugar kinase